MRRHSLKYWDHLLHVGSCLFWGLIVAKSTENKSIQRDWCWRIMAWLGKAKKRFVIFKVHLQRSVLKHVLHVHVYMCTVPTLKKCTQNLSKWMNVCLHTCMCVQVHISTCILHIFEYLCVCVAVCCRPFLSKVWSEGQKPWHHQAIGGNIETQVPTSDTLNQNLHF